MSVNYKGIDKAELLVGLYNGSHQQGFGALQPMHNLTVEEARELLEQTSSFDYLYGKVMKINLSDNEEFEERLYDRDNGYGQAQMVVNGIRQVILQKATTEEEKAAITEEDRISKELWSQQSEKNEELGKSDQMLGNCGLEEPRNISKSIR